MKIVDRQSGALVQVAFYRYQPADMACMPWADAPVTPHGIHALNER